MNNRLRLAAARIAATRNEPPASPLAALRKIFIQERRDWSRPGAPRIGWKRGELIEVLQARSIAELREEWGDVGYYAAQSWRAVWLLYRIVTPRSIIEAACAKFERRAAKEYVK
jgi:hypothetical protein